MVELQSNRLSFDLTEILAGLSAQELMELRHAIREEESIRFETRYKGCVFGENENAPPTFKVPLKMLNNLVFHNESKIECIKWVRAHGPTNGAGHPALGLQEVKHMIEQEMERYREICQKES